MKKFFLPFVPDEVIQDKVQVAQSRYILQL